MQLTGSFLSGQQLHRGCCHQSRSPVPFLVEAKAIGKKEKIRAKHRAQRRKGKDGTAERPRLAVYRSNNNIYAQVIDDSVGHTLAALSTISKSMKEKIEGSVSANKEGATAVGKQLAELCLSKNIKTVFFDRGGLQYHGRVQALADGAREGGLQF